MDVEEARTEALASFINVFITAGELAQQKKWSDDELKQYVCQMWALEKCFSLYQVAKILHLGSFKSWAEFTKKTSDKRIKDEGRTIEYYILKALLMLDASQLIKNFTQEELLAQMLKATASEKKFGDLIDTLLEIIQKQGEDSPLLKTGRQTIIERAHDRFRID